MEVHGYSSRGRLEGCSIVGNVGGGVYVYSEGDLKLGGCTICDHAASDQACGVFVHVTARGRVTVGADCVFARNSGGDVVRR